MQFNKGGVCLNILREDWRPVLDVNAVIYGLIQLFGNDVNSEDPLNREAAALLQTDRTQVCISLVNSACIFFRSQLCA